ncbi:MAG: PTS sugar transporter subunit IIC [Erysipelotrichaceae bacterium]|nr:PTS sugar transporter subunit IIC [Erysipelotrichaceae bacterium]
MEKLSAWLEQKLFPLAVKVEKQRHLKAISRTFMSIIPFMTLGSLALVVIEPPMDYTTMEPGFFRSFMAAWSSFAGAVGMPVGAIYRFCLEFVALFVAAGIGYFLSQEYKLRGFTPTILAVISYMILAVSGIETRKTFDYMGGTGIFAAIFSAILSIELLRVLLDKKVGYISLSGHGVPEALTEAFAMLVPTGIVLLVVALLHTLIVKITGNTFPALMAVIMEPLLSATNSIWGGALLVILVMSFWWFGIHDSAITGPMGAFWATALAANISAYSAGTATTALPYIITEPFWWFFIMIGGSGATFGLVFVLLFLCKSKQFKTVGKLGLIPAFFNINEPVIFGVPLMMNPVMFVPFVGVPLLNCIVTYLAMASGIVAKTVSYPGWNMFCPIAALIATVDFKALLLVLILIVLDALFYLPFIKVLDKQKVAEEEE